MKFLVTADIHGLVPAITRFADMLRDGEYDCGIIAGDIIDDGFKPEEMHDPTKAFMRTVDHIEQKFKRTGNDRDW